MPAAFCAEFQYTDGMRFKGLTTATMSLCPQWRGPTSHMVAIKCAPPICVVICEVCGGENYLHTKFEADASGFPPHLTRNKAIKS